MNIGSTLKNPWVLGGGALIGFVMLMHSSAANANTTAQANAVNPTVMSGAVAMNTAALGAQIQETTIAAQYGAAKFASDVQDHANILQYLTTVDNNNTLIEQAQLTSNAGIVNSIIASSTAIVVDQANNAAQAAAAWTATNTAQVQASAQVDIAKLQADAAKAASKNNLIGTIVGTIGKVATVGIGAATGVPIGGGFGGF